MIADDFTGACDVGVQFEKHGMSTSVYLTKPSFNELKNAASDLLVLDTETRNKSEKIAYRNVRDFCSLCEEAKIEIVYKKIDSTLRGNVGSELKALLDVSKQHSVLVCPVYPQYGRTVVNGHLFVRGVPVDKTEFVNDPVRPVRSSDIKTLLAMQPTAKVENVPLSIVRRGSRYVTKAILRLRKSGVRIVSTDAENLSDLRNIANACFRSDVIPCGSAGLAEEIAAGLKPARRKIVVLSASTNEATLKELRKSAKYARTLLIRASAAFLEGDMKTVELKRIRRLVEHGLVNHDVVIVCSALYKTDFYRKSGSQPASRRFGDPITKGLAIAVSPIALAGSVDAVVLTGGAMAAAFLKRIQAIGLRLEREILPGVPLGTVMSGRSQGLRVVTKAGGFGLPGSMRKIIEDLTESFE